MKRLEWAMLIGLIVSVFLGSVAAFEEDCAVIRQDVVRLHILAESDDAEDQARKLQVRDAVLEHAGDLFAPAQSQQDACQMLKERLPELEQLAKETLAAQGCTAPVKAQVVNMYFETREYDGFDLPAGRYDALRITIGAGKGRNWWCVVYPPLCVGAAQPASADAQRAETEVRQLGQTPVYKPKLAVVELWQGFQEWTRQAG